MTRSRQSDGETAPVGVDAGPQGGAGGVGGEPKGAQLQDARSAPPETPVKESDAAQREHSSQKAQPGYRARPAGQSGLGAQEDLASTIRAPQGEGNYLATDQGDKPLRNG